MCDNLSLMCFDSKLWPFWLLTCSSVIRVSTSLEAAISASQEWPLSWAWLGEKRSLLQQMEPEDWQVEPQQQTLQQLEDAELGKASKKKKRKRKKIKKRRHKNKPTQISLGQPANLLLANLATLPVPSLTKPPHHMTDISKPIKHIDYIWRKGSLLKKKKQQYLSHLGYVFYPLVKFVTFFTVLNPFTLAVFFFMLISPVVFGLLGFTAISLILKPVMSLLFAVKRRINYSVPRRPHKKRRPPQQQRPITIHKHFYQHPRPHEHQRQGFAYNPILPQVRLQLERQRQRQRQRQPQPQH